MGLLHQVLDEIEAATGPLTVNELGCRLDVDASALLPMIEFWVRKGRLRDEDTAVTEASTCATGNCGSSCAGANSCAYIARMPRSYAPNK
ncbi:MAG TPA: hypothetical protein EYP41_14380 [Anaerolineae bacterium]|nr:hypothetical protein [Anaerolineae bacterium]HIP70713.1 hypothetical protein [Anaerolineae bacterium]